MTPTTTSDPAEASEEQPVQPVEHQQASTTDTTDRSVATDGRHTDEHDDRSCLSLSRRATLGLLGLGGLGLLTGEAAGRGPPPGRGPFVWADIDDDGLLETPDHDGIDVTTVEADSVETDDLGTSDATPLELSVNNQRALRLEPTDPTVGANVIAGHPNNSVAEGVYAATIAGGSADFPNEVTGDFGTVGGGRANTASRSGATVGGGAFNAARGSLATVGGGDSNVASNIVATVGGGIGNVASHFGATIGGGLDNAASHLGTAVGGGESNAASGRRATIGGGFSNEASGPDATIGGGSFNEASDFAATVGGGRANTSGFQATVGGGDSNTASGGSATVGGGFKNAASGTGAIVPGGSGNVASGDSATVGGGSGNMASGGSATVPGGLRNEALGTAGFAAGQNAKADHDGAFVWADSNDSAFASSGANTWNARATGGARFVSAINSAGDPTAGVELAAGGGSWAALSDRNAKKDVAPVDPGDVLSAVKALPINTWSYKTESAGVRHMGPMAQDFAAAFDLGDTETQITNIDADGVALAAIQGLAIENETLREHNAELEDRLNAVEERIAALGPESPAA